MISLCVAKGFFIHEAHERIALKFNWTEEFSAIFRNVLGR